MTDKILYMNKSIMKAYGVGTVVTCPCRDGDRDVYFVGKVVRIADMLSDQKCTVRSSNAGFVETHYMNLHIAGPMDRLLYT